MKKIIVLSILLTSGVMAFAQNDSNKGITKEAELTAKGTIKYYGEKAGLIRPCKGTCVLVCKEVSSLIQEVRSPEDSKIEYVKVSDGNRYIIVEKSRIDFSNGSIK
ncbi:MAG: hypothetical protein PHT92_12040 [Bacteroidales bacterium]|jgi:hypothetical protein|nr:hypothetical protein [Bacteroidales bacterium]